MQSLVEHLDLVGEMVDRPTGLRVIGDPIPVGDLLCPERRETLGQPALFAGDPWSGDL
jgi:hypothetical protein